MKKPLFKRWWFWIIVIIIAFTMFGGENKGSTNVQPTSQAANEDEKPDLELLNSKRITKGSWKYVTGTIKNNTSKEYSYVQVEINLYDNNENQLGSTLANVNNLEAGGTWKFEAIIYEEKATRYKIKEITGF
jgi:hypothetical protein